MNAETPGIGVVPVGDVAEVAPKIIAAHLSGYLDLSAEVLPAVEHPAYALDPVRFQYDAGRILRRLESRTYGGYAKLIAVADVDIFVPIFTYVFGEARQGGKMALVSLARLKKNRDGSVTPQDTVYERAVKVALHELGHLFHLSHCRGERRCLMRFCGGLAELDRNPLYLCRYCSLAFREAVCTR
jgi:archaemetzincin